ncbi:DNA cytosine methyltransferase [Nocardiopsis dassonvillei]|nr:DNA cytosine methyltransferase [Nocardiopsis dassonvillei]
MGLNAALGTTELLWCADADPYVDTVLQHRFPTVRNIGDITRADYAALPRPHILTAGFPCQDISTSGRRLGIQEGTRSGIWSHVVEATRVLGPQQLFVENVSALRHRNGGLGRVLGDLANIGYDAHWLCLRAADLGAPHSRERLFLLAHPRTATPVPHPPSTGRRTGRDRSRETTTCRTPGQHHRRRHPMAGHSAASPRERKYQHACGRSERTGLRRHHPSTPSNLWGDYAWAIARWEQVLGRPAPWPTRVGQRGGARPSPRWVEWLMGLPAGWVTDCPVPAPQQLQILGNGVIPLQAEVAFRRLRSRVERMAARS